MSRKWRPSLAMVLGGALSGTLILSLSGLVAFRYLGPEIGFRNAAVVLGLLITGATTVLGWLLVRLLLRPITALEHFATQVRATQIKTPPPPTHFGTRELRATAQSVIDMAITLRNREMTIRSFSDHITHELKTPVAVLKAATELLQDGRNLAREDLRLVDQIAGAGIQMERQLEAMRQAAQAREIRHDGISTLNEVCAALRHDFPTLKLCIRGGDIAIPLAQQGLSIVLHHLLSNALSHGGQTVQLSAQRQDIMITLLIEDDGTGISSGNAARIFDPFFTTNRENGGTGMGLSIVRNTLRAHGGDIFFVAKNAGAGFAIHFDLNQ